MVISWNTHGIFMVYHAMLMEYQWIYHLSEPSMEVHSLISTVDTSGLNSLWNSPATWLITGVDSGNII